MRSGWQHGCGSPRRRVGLNGHARRHWRRFGAGVPVGRAAGGRHGAAGSSRCAATTAAAAAAAAAGVRTGRPHGGAVRRRRPGRWTGPHWRRPAAGFGRQGARLDGMRPLGGGHAVDVCGPLEGGQVPGWNKRQRMRHMWVLSALANTFSLTHSNSMTASRDGDCPVASGSQDSHVSPVLKESHTGLRRNRTATR